MPQQRNSRMYDRLVEEFAAVKSAGSSEGGQGDEQVGDDVKKVRTRAKGANGRALADYGA